MAWLNWFLGKKTPAPAHSRGTGSELATSQLKDRTRPMMGGKATNSAAQPAALASAQRLEQRRNERNAKRELLFQVVRESMVRVGVLSSAFRFKVLSLDQRGRSFLVMIELSAEFSGEVEKLAEIETMIAQNARHRFEIVVQAVYWRYFSATSAPASAPTSAPLLGAMHAPISRPAPLFGMEGPGASASAAASALQHAKAAAPVSHHVTGSFPIIGATAAQKAAGIPVRAGQDEPGDDEIAAFRRALASGVTPSAVAASPASPRPAPAQAPAAKAPDLTTLEIARSKLLLTGYEETEMTDEEPMPALSGTQYGEFR